MSDRSRHNHDAWNELCDADALWGPLVFLRPGQLQIFTSTRLLLVTSLFGIFYGMVGNVCLALFRRVHLCGPVNGLVLPLSLTVVAFICGELTFRRAWNSRVRDPGQHDLQ